MTNTKPITTNAKQNPVSATATAPLLFSPWRGVLFPSHLDSPFVFQTLPLPFLFYYPTSFPSFSLPFLLFCFLTIPPFLLFSHHTSSSPTLLRSTSLQPRTCIKRCNVVPLVQSSPGSRAEPNCPDWRRLNSFLFSSSIFRR